MYQAVIHFSIDFYVATVLVVAGFTSYEIVTCVAALHRRWKFYVIVNRLRLIQTYCFYPRAKRLLRNILFTNHNYMVCIILPKEFL